MVMSFVTAPTDEHILPLVLICSDGSSILLVQRILWAQNAIVTAFAFGTFASGETSG